MSAAPQDRLVIALDVNSLPDAQKIIDETRDFCGTYKVGLELFSACGPAAIKLVKQSGAQVFLDLKLHDIPNTVASAITQAVAQDVRFLTVHALGGPAMLKTAAQTTSLVSAQLQLLAVSVLTHHEEDDFKKIGFELSSRELALALLQNAYEAGLRGCVCSPLEARFVRAAFPAMIIVCPGIRPQGSAANDQTRIATPAMAIQNGADFLVVGRPITKASDMKQAAAAVLQEIKEGLHAKK